MGRLELAYRRAGPGTLRWEAEHSLLSFSSHREGGSISLQSRTGIGAGARGSFPIFHPNSECELKGHASPACPHRPPSNAQAGLSGCTPVITLTSYSVVSREGLTRRTQDLWVLEQWTQGHLQSGLRLNPG